MASVTLGSSTVTTALQVLTQAEAFLAGQPITINLPQETTVVEGVTVSVAPTTVTITK